jgi:hypothetical protein
MNSIKYIIIHTGYDDRLRQIMTKDHSTNEWTTEEYDILDGICKQYKPVYFPSHICDQDHYTTVKTLLEGDKMMKRMLLDDSACFIQSSHTDDLYDLVGKLSDIGYCAFFGTIVSVHIKGNGSILVYEMDCESG